MDRTDRCTRPTKKACRSTPPQCLVVGNNDPERMIAADLALARHAEHWLRRMQPGKKYGVNDMLTRLRRCD